MSTVNLSTLDGTNGFRLSGVAAGTGNELDNVLTGNELNNTLTSLAGSDTLSGMERAQFSDQGLAFDLGLNQAAGNTVRIIGAAFDAPAIDLHPEWVGIGLDFFDGGMSMPDVCGLVATILGMSDAAFVTTLYTNVTGVAPDIAARDVYVGMLQGSGGSLTQGQLLELAANVPLNEQNIGLAGLQQSGVEFV